MSGTIFDVFIDRKWADEHFARMLDLYYDEVLATDIDVIKRLLPIEHHGFNGSYLEDWMIKDVDPALWHGYTKRGFIYDWFGDKTTCDIIDVCGNSLDEIYRRLLMKYISHLDTYKSYPLAANELNFIITNLAQTNET